MTEQLYGNAIADILKPLDCGRHNWDVNGDEVLVEIDGEVDIRDLFQKRIVEGEEFQRIITNNFFYTIFVELKAFIKGKQVDEISSYKDFKNSDCEFILLITDGVYVEIYCKDKCMLESLYNNSFHLENSNSKPRINNHHSPIKLSINVILSLQTVQVNGHYNH